MQKVINKELVKKRFQRSLKTYDNQAAVQKRMALNLMDFLTDNADNRFDKILEIGCGTGNLTEQILNKLSFKDFFSNDIVEESEEFIKKLSDQISFISGDAENIELPNNLDLIISNASFQWISDLSEFFKNLHSRMNKDGILAFTSFSPDNFIEISHITGCKLNTYSYNELVTLIRDQFELIYSFNEVVKLDFDTPLDVLEHIKQMGVNAINQRAWTKKELNEFKISYMKHFSNDGKVNLTYCPDYYILKAK